MDSQAFRYEVAAKAPRRVSQGGRSLEIPASGADPRPRRLGGTYTPELDGVRAVAIWVVMLMHGFLAFPDYAPGVLARWISPVQYGWLGVDLFFVLSGFLITGILIDAQGTPHYWRNFYARRALRIWPAYLGFVLVASLFYRGYGSYFALATGFAANFADALGIAKPHGPSVLWTLAIEEQFYLLWPIVVLLAGPRRLLWIAGVIVLVTPALRGVWRATGGDVEGMAGFPWFRFDGLALGAFLASWVRLPGVTLGRHVWLAVSLVTLSLAVTVLALPYGVFTTRSVASGALRFTQAHLIFGAGLLLAFAFSGRWWTAPLRSSFARVSASLSYCLYLVHVCVCDLWWWLESQYGWRPAGVDYTSWAFVRTAVVVIISFGIALVSRRYLEEPALRLKRYFV